MNQYLYFGNQRKNKMKCLVTGGAGYIGSHVSLRLIEEGHEVDIIDNLSTGCTESLECLKRNGWEGKFLESNIGDCRKVSQLLQSNSYDICFHFAAHTYVGESVRKPIMYFQNNLSVLPEFLSSLLFHGVNNLVFSSSSGIYGKQKYPRPIKETDIIDPINPYAMTKYWGEEILKSCGAKYPDFKYTCLRYFNVVGNNMEGKIGDYVYENKETIIPMCLSAAAGIRPAIKINGTDYDTKDGTCIRDYIHVDDLVNAHIAIMDKLDNKPYNVGNGVGYSVREIVDSCLKITGKGMNVEEGIRRPGDPEYLCADVSAFTEKTGWVPKIFDIDDITKSAWNWIKITKSIP